MGFNSGFKGLNIEHIKSFNYVFPLDGSPFCYVIKMQCIEYLKYEVGLVCTQAVWYILLTQHSYTEIRWLLTTSFGIAATYAILSSQRRTSIL